MMMSGVSFFAGLISLFVYVAIPILIILIVLWIYRLKQNSDIQVGQNKQIIELLQKRNEH